MKKKLEGIPRYSSEKTQIDARLFNEVRLSFLRLDASIRFSLPGLRHLDIMLDEETWICVDNSLNDIPVFAWTEFETHHRANLHEPISCMLFTYHQHADVIIEQVKKSIYEILDDQLHPDKNDKD